MAVPLAVWTSTSPVATKLTARFGGDTAIDTVTKEASNNGTTAIPILFRASQMTLNVQRCSVTRAATRFSKTTPPTCTQPTSPSKSGGSLPPIMRRVAHAYGTHTADFSCVREHCVLRGLHTESSAEFLRIHGMSTRIFQNRSAQIICVSP